MIDLNLILKKVLYIFGKDPKIENLSEDELKKIYTVKKSISLSKVLRGSANKIPFHLSLLRKRSCRIKNTHTLSKASIYTSVILAPGNDKKVRSFKIAHLQRKTAFITIFAFVVFITAISYITYTKAENMILKQSMAELNRKTYEQNVQMAEKLATLDELIKVYEDSEIEMDKFIGNYERIINKYLEGRVTVAVSARSGERAGTNFINDISDLRVILEGLESLSENQEETLVDMTTAKNNLNTYLSSLPTLWPASGKISSGFGNRRDPFTRRTSFHKGIDIAANYGSDILASGAGTVIYTGTYNELGKTIIIDHGNDLKTVYGHTSAILVKNGDIVGKGDLIGKVGSTGRSTGAHLHFEIRIDDTPVDPESFLDKK